MTGIPTIAQVQDAVAREYGVPSRTMREPAPRGTGKVGINTYAESRPRQTAMALSVLLTNHSYTRIGHFFGGRERTTVRHAHFTAAKRRKADPKFHEKMRRLTLELIGAGR